jgi:cysteinyl-tRNA synthetase
VAFRLYDSLQRQIVPFEPVRPGEVSIYHCGLTVQSAPHVGHIRKEVVFDVLRRWLTHCGHKVSIVANVTDIDDKILDKSAQRGVPWYAHAYEFELELHKAYASLGCQPPTYEPRATGHIPEMHELIAALIDNGHAYVAPDGSGDVYFDVRSWPSYGVLSGQRVDQMEAAADADPRGKRDPRDFALWKGHKPGEPLTASWPSPWGRGRPGWHIECSAMAEKYLDAEDGLGFDIHGGGLDLRFPHHENELAQAQGAGRRFAKYWMHNAWVTAAGEKMSKSMGNGALVSEVTKAYPARAVRLFLLAPHYRSMIEFCEESLVEATAQLARIDAYHARAADYLSGSAPSAGVAASAAPSETASGAGSSADGDALPEDFTAAMDDDLGTPAAMAVLFAAIRDGNTAIDDGDRPRALRAFGQVCRMLDVFGLNPDDPVWAKSAGDNLTPVVDGLVNAMLAQRQAARERKDYAAADAIRDALGEAGLKVEDTPRGVRWSLS